MFNKDTESKTCHSYLIGIVEHRATPFLPAKDVFGHFVRVLNDNVWCERIMTAASVSEKRKKGNPL